MAVNAGASPDLIISSVLSADDELGYNFSTYEWVDMMEAGIVDPVKVTRLALQNAVSVSSVLLTTNYAVIDV
jgi:chaperonin GroEL